MRARVRVRVRLTPVQKRYVVILDGAHLHAWPEVLGFVWVILQLAQVMKTMLCRGKETSQEEDHYQSSVSSSERKRRM